MMPMAMVIMTGMISAASTRTAPRWPRWHRLDGPGEWIRKRDEWNTTYGVGGGPETL